MEYRALPHGGEKLSVIGMGSAVIGEKPEAEIVDAVQTAVENGVNLFDMAGGRAAIFPAYGKALAGMRDKVFLQIHFGANYASGEYGWTTDLDAVRASVQWQLEQLGTDRIDFGFIHCLDEERDLSDYRDHGVLDYVLDLKKQGVVRHVGLSSHTPALAQRVLDMGVVDILMFSVNPVYDYGQGDYGVGSPGDRQALYRRCEKEGVAISVMKPFCGGKLLDAAKSPFHAALTQSQCIQYALDKPGVASVLPGFGDKAELLEGLAYLRSSREERDYSILGAFTPEDALSQCVYCQHCHPCPAGLDVALINKYYDLAQLGDPLAREHYLTLEKTADDCTQCGRCNGRCPFRVDQKARMQDVLAYFGK